MTTKKQTVTETGKFVYTQNLEEAVNLAFNAEENIILFGKGGHASIN